MSLSIVTFVGFWACYHGLLQCICICVCVSLWVCLCVYLFVQCITLSMRGYVLLSLAAEVFGLKSDMDLQSPGGCTAPIGRAVHDQEAESD